MAPKGFKKDGSPAKPRKDGSPRIAGGGYSEKKQIAWCSGVLDRAKIKAKEMFGNAADIVIARYAIIDSGYEGVKRLYRKKRKNFKSLLSEFVYRQSKSRVFANKYIDFLKQIELTNFNKINLNNQTD